MGAESLRPADSLRPPSRIPATALPQPGGTLAGRFAIERVLGKGATSAVFAATHVRLRRRVAIKMLLPQVAEDPDVAHRFQREARALARLQGPNVAEILDVATSPEGVPYLVMEYLDGEDLGEAMKARADFPVAEAVGIALQACSAMCLAHAQGIVHRDLKPANLFLAGRGGERVVKVLDFGISKVTGGATALTATEALLGTPVYMAPEQIEAAKAVDARADVWSLAVILYEMLAAELPFQGATATAIITSIMCDAPKPLADRRPDAPAGLVAAVHKALAHDPEQRFPSMATFAEAIAPYGPAGSWKPPEAPAAAPTPAGGEPPLSKLRAQELAAEAASRIKKRIALVAVGVLLAVVAEAYFVMSR